MTQLNNHNMGALSAAVETPTYDRQAVTPGIVHIGVGGFHRAHQAMYVDALMNQGEALNWGIVGVGGHARRQAHAAGPRCARLPLYAGGQAP